jgi:hypothetical protein
VEGNKHDGSVSNGSKKVSFKHVDMIKLHVLKEGLAICLVQQSQQHLYQTPGEAEDVCKADYTCK